MIPEKISMKLMKVKKYMITLVVMMLTVKKYMITLVVIIFLLLKKQK